MDTESIFRQKAREANRERPGHRAGWSHQRPMGHYCFPPLIYPPNVGPNSEWSCSHDGLLWRAEGVQIVDGLNSENYPILPGNTPVLGPERWIPVIFEGCGWDEGLKTDANGVFIRPQKRMLGDGRNTVHPLHQMGLYDWRSMAPYYVKMLRGMLKGVGQDWRAVTDYFDQIGSVQ